MNKEILRKNIEQVIMQPCNANYPKKIKENGLSEDGKYIMAVSDEKPLIWHIASCCKFAKLKDELFEQCSLKEIIE